MNDERLSEGLRRLTLTRNFLPQAEGSCLVELGETKVIVTASVQDSVPPWLIGRNKGWLTAEYGMLPRATQSRNRRPANATQQNGRTMEIQRLIGRALRIVTDLKALGERTIYIDCDVLSADGGTRVTSIIGAAIALYDASQWLLDNGMTERSVMREFVAALSVGIVKGEVTVDLDYSQDSTADVDMNIVMTESGGLVEVQGTGEGATFSREELDELLDAAEPAIQRIIMIQKEAVRLS